MSKFIKELIFGRHSEWFPIPGTKRVERVQENLGALQDFLSEDDLAEIERISPKGSAVGGRF